MEIETGKFVRVNRKACEITCFSEAELLSRSLEDVIYPDDRPRTLHELRRLSEGETSEYATDTRCITKRGSEFWAILTVAAVPLPQGKPPLHAVAIFTDITARKAAEQQHEEVLRRKEAEIEELTESSRLKDEFLAIVSHELRTPLNAILGWALLLSQGRLKESAVAQALEVIERNAKAQARLVDDLLDVSRIISGKLRLEFRSTNINDLMNATLEVLLPAVQSKRIRVFLELPEEDTIVDADPARLQQVMENLVGNAIKFTAAGRRVHVRAENIGGTAVRISVRDAGAGIQAPFLPHIFERFSQHANTGKGPQQGLGLGLAIARQIVELHGGTIAVESAGENCGTTFWVTLPLRQTAPQNVPAAPPRNQSAGAS